MWSIHKVMDAFTCAFETSLVIQHKMYHYIESTFTFEFDTSQRGLMHTASFSNMKIVCS